MLHSKTPTDGRGKSLSDTALRERIILPNLKKDKEKYQYNDDKYKIPLSFEFVESIKKSKSIKDLGNCVKSKEVFILGTKKGGYKIAEHYHKHIPSSEYILLPNSDHNFSREEDREEILSIIKTARN